MGMLSSSTLFFKANYLEILGQGFSRKAHDFVNLCADSRKFMGLFFFKIYMNETWINKWTDMKAHFNKKIFLNDFVMPIPK